MLTYGGLRHGKNGSQKRIDDDFSGRFVAKRLCFIWLDFVIDNFCDKECDDLSWMYVCVAVEELRMEQRETLMAIFKVLRCAAFSNFP